MLTPKRWKYRKPIIRSITGKAYRGSTVAFGDYGLKATTSAYVTNKQIEAARKVIVRSIKKVGKVWIRIFPDVPFTRKGLEMPMGTGKGDVDIYTALVKKGRVLFEINGLSRELAQETMIKAAKKLPLKARFVARGEIK
ncbi:MAG: 50S ribosomal protein L16 [candidate division SR1 bacterium]|nr:50S ribosomal protein L16 [candidate division SR1 bacterium]